MNDESLERRIADLIARFRVSVTDSDRIDYYQNDERPQLQAMGEQAIPILIQYIEHPDYITASLCAAALVGCDDRRATQPIIKRIDELGYNQWNRDLKPEVSRLLDILWQALWPLSDPAAIDPVLALSQKHHDSKHRDYHVVNLLSHIGDARTTRIYIDMELQVGSSRTDLLPFMDRDAAFHYLVQHIEQNKHKVTAIQLLGSMRSIDYYDPNPFEYLMTLLEVHRDEYKVLREVVLALEYLAASLSVDFRRLFPAFVYLLNCDDWGVRYIVIGPIGMLGAEAVPPLAALLKTTKRPPEGDNFTKSSKRLYYNDLVAIVDENDPANDELLNNAMREKIYKTLVRIARNNVLDTLRELLKQTTDKEEKRHFYLEMNYSDSGGQ